MLKKGILTIVSGPAGSGKGTVVQKLRDGNPEIGFSVSATTRNPRPGEADGVNYYFVTREKFEEMLRNGEILEHTEYAGNYYGTPLSEVKKCLDEGRDIILEIEVDGATQVKKLMPEAVLVMLIPPDFATLEARLRGRGTETDEVIKTRLARSREEIALADRYDYIIVNEDNGIDECAARLGAIIESEKYRSDRMKNVTDSFFS